MKLIRKKSAPLVIDNYGIAHLNLTIGYFAIPEDKLNKWLEIHCAYYHTESCDKAPLQEFSTFVIKFNSESSNGWPTYANVKSKITIEDDGQLTISDSSIEDWLLNQTVILDFEGKVFSENWEIVN